jgi:hypothetical protein
MDPLSISASIAGVLSLADTVFRLVFNFSKQAVSAKKDVQALADEVRSISGLLHNLMLLAEGFGDTDGLSTTILRVHHLESCYHSLSSLKSRLDDAEKDFSSSNRIVSLQRRLRWPLSSSETKTVLEQLSRHKQTINVALSADSVSALQKCLSRQENNNRMTTDIHSNVKITMDIITRIGATTDRLKVLDFFLKSNPQPHLETALRLRQQFTGLWLTKGDAFTNWLTSRGTGLWLNGIPGAGKTVLAGAMIEEATNFCGLSSAVAYFFCDASRGTVVSVTDLLATLASQLGRQSEESFDILRRYYQSLHPERQLPRPITLDELEKVIRNMADTFHQVFIIVDAVDEYGDEVDDVLNSLRSIFDGTDSCSLAILSRSEHAIQEHLEDVFESITISAQKEDVELYVAAAIEAKVKSKRLRLKSPTIKEEIKQTLVDRAKGMLVIILILENL